MSKDQAKVERHAVKWRGERRSITNRIQSVGVKAGQSPEKAVAGGVEQPRHEQDPPRTHQISIMPWEWHIEWHKSKFEVYCE